jgi:hypothetical protein
VASRARPSSDMVMVGVGILLFGPPGGMAVFFTSSALTWTHSRTVGIVLVRVRRDRASMLSRWTSWLGEPCFLGSHRLDASSCREYAVNSLFALPCATVTSSQTGPEPKLGRSTLMDIYATTVLYRTLLWAGSQDGGLLSGRKTLSVALTPHCARLERAHGRCCYQSLNAKNMRPEVMPSISTHPRGWRDGGHTAGNRIQSLACIESPRHHTAWTIVPGR